MSDTILEFQSTFPSLLQQEAERVLQTHLEVGNQFKSADSFSYLLTSENDKFVGKIYKLKDWPPEGKLEEVNTLLNQHGIPHEELLYKTHQHQIFTFGWQLSRYIPGGTAKELLSSGKLSSSEYFVKLGQLLQKIHEIKLNYFGSLHDPDVQFKAYDQVVKHELANQDYSNLSTEYDWAQKIITEAKENTLANVGKFHWEQASLVHDDANVSNVIWKDGTPILIDWSDALAAPPLRDITTLTFREDEPILHFIEKGYGKTVAPDELRFHQIMRFIRLGRFFYFENKNIDELRKMMTRLEVLLNRELPFGV